MSLNTGHAQDFGGEIPTFAIKPIPSIISSSKLIQKQPLRILTWEGYVTQTELDDVNGQLAALNYPYYVEVIKPFAEGAKQMFDLIRGQKCDITFLTLFFIKMENEQTSTLIQPINTHSPRLTNYSKLREKLINLPMGLNKQNKPLYIPWGGGVYGFYINRNVVPKNEVPKSVSALWQAKWQNHYSLNKSQAWYNVGLALMSLDESPFYIHELVNNQQRTKLVNLVADNGELQIKLNDLYGHSAQLWTASPQFSPELNIVSSWGPEINQENQKGNHWEKINFKENDMMWLDTINFVKDLQGQKLEAAEVFANYFIGKKAQKRITNELSMFAASSEVKVNKALGDPEKLFNYEHFVPPYDSISYGIMKHMTDKAEQVFESKTKK